MTAEDNTPKPSQHGKITFDEAMEGKNIDARLKNAGMGDIDPKVMERLLGIASKTTPQATAKPSPAVPTPITPATTSAPAAPPTPDNPLSKYFRNVGVFVKLPSNGQFYPQGAIEYSVNGEVAVYPMTVNDELALKSPDALMNGHAIEQIIRSCCPGVKNPRILVSPDLDALLIAIRATSFGKTMDLEANCPKCGQENNYGLDLNHVLETMTPMQGPFAVQIGPEVVVHLRPFNFESNIKATLAAFEQAKIMQLVSNKDVDEKQKVEMVSSSVTKISELNTELLVSAIEKISIPSGDVTNPEFIAQYLRNAARKDVDKIEERLKSLNDAGVTKKHKLKCKNCQHDWEAEVSYDPTSFFG